MSIRNDESLRWHIEKQERIHYIHPHCLRPNKMPGRGGERNSRILTIWIVGFKLIKCIFMVNAAYLQNH